MAGRKRLDVMRDEIRAVYPGYSWQRKVDQMEPNQIVAIWHNFQERKMLKPKLKLGKVKEEYRQLTIWDFIPMEENNG